MISQPKQTTTPSTGPGADTQPVAAGPRPCPNCSATVPADCAWCASCGLQVADPCWECGRGLPAGTAYCPACGTANTEPAVVQCRQCASTVQRGHVYCTQCGTQARLACRECERPLRREWKQCPACGGDPEWEESGVGQEPARLRGDEPNDPSAWLQAAPKTREADDANAAAVKAYEAGRFAEAARLFEQAVELDPTNAGYWTNLGVAYGECGDDLQAFTAYRRAVELNPGEVSAYLNMGYLYMERERTAEAREMWEKVIALAPDSSEAAEARQNLSGAEEV
ncbi:MAG: tetratricopeptide repeat protein [Armatimonadota bacterium]